MHVVRLGADDAEELLEAVRRSRELHYPWVAPPQSLTELRDYLGQPPEIRIGYGIREPGGELAGVVNINSIIRGAFDNGFLGFFALAPHQRQGLMQRGMAVVIGRAFGEHELHRLEANVQPGNERSVALVRRLGFRLEGHSPRYLRIEGEWRDHDRYALTAEEWPEAAIRGPEREAPA